ncbi:DUF4173 domain-containing protein [Rhodococcus olei]|uniref:DUF4173 domain-containing protein n=1 Tax=Rhodococcus olei TaxID=2161675 RepID=A0ABP8P418_9NOCA
MTTTIPHRPAAGAVPDPLMWPRDVWRPDRTSIPPRATVGAALGVGLLGALTLQPSVAGVAYPLTGIAVAATVLATVPPRPRPALLVGAAAALALLVVAALRDAPGLVLACVLLSWLVWTAALLGTRTWTGHALAPFVPWCTPLRVAGWVRRGRTRSGGGVPLGRVLVVAAVSVALVAVFGALLVSADPEFGAVFDALVPSVRVRNPLGRLAVGAAVAAVALSAAYLRRRPPRPDAFAPAPGRPSARWEWAVPVAALDLLFAGFVAVQLRELFGGRGHVLRSTDLTYAGYARQGFWQLCAVTALTLVVIAVAVRRIDRTRPRDRVLARLVLGALCLLSLVVVASAVHRMSLYETVFGLTRLRLGVMVAELWFGAIVGLLLAAGWRLRGRWLPTAVLVSAVAGVLALAVVNPDGYIAERNVQRYERTGDLDVGYLRGLSADAVPALDRLPEPARSCALAGVDIGADGAWYEYNAARSRAREILRERPIGRCEPVWG